MIVLMPASIRYGGHRRQRNGRPMRAPPTSCSVRMLMYVPSSTVSVVGGGVGDRYGYGNNSGSTVRTAAAAGMPPIRRDGPCEGETVDDADGIVASDPEAVSEPELASDPARATATTTTAVRIPAANARPNEPNRCQRATMTGIHVMM